MSAKAPIRLAALAAALCLAALVGLDLLLRVLGWVPPDDPLLFFTRTREARIDPFVPAGTGELQIRPDWVNDGLGLRGRRGRRAGRQFLLPGFRPARLAVKKPPGLLRVFALGGSTTYGLYVGARDAFPARLETLLRERLKRPVEVINLGCPGFASDRVDALLPRVLELQPDLLVVVTGHNEMLGGNVGPTAGLSPALRLRAWLLRTSTLFAWWNHLLAGTLRRVETEQVREEVAALRAGQIPTYVPEEVPASARVPPDAAFRERAARRFAAHVADILARARKAGVPVLFGVPAANLRSPPGLSVHAAGFARKPEFDTALRAGKALLEAGKPERALERLDEAIRLSPGYAAAHYARGDALRALGREEEARAAYRRAVDCDARTHRITTPLEQALLTTLRKAGVEPVDLRPVLQPHLDDATRDALFVDHLHPTAEGHARIAAALLPRAAALLRERASGRARPPSSRALRSGADAV